MSQEFLASSVASRLGARIVDGDLQAGDVLRLGDIERGWKAVPSRRRDGTAFQPMGRVVTQGGALAHVWQQA